jgi:hypothetical protein
VADVASGLSVTPAEETKKKTRFFFSLSLPFVEDLKHFNIMTALQSSKKYLNAHAFLSYISGRTSLVLLVHFG